MNKTSTKHTLLVSVLAVVMCAAMLIGTTYAWFTDVASTSVNRIVSGKLDIELEYATEWNDDGSVKTWKNAEGEKLNFLTADKRTENILWEPGATYRLPELRIINNSNLAIKYKVVITGINDTSKLNKVIDWDINGVVPGEEMNMLPTQTEQLITISGHMKDDAGNEYQNKSIEDISITVYATQDTVEYDNNGNTYDEDALYPSTRSKLFTTDGVYNINTKANGFMGVVKVMKGANVEVNADLTATEGKNKLAIAVWANGSDTKVTISGGYYTQEVTGNDSQYDMIYADGGATIEITGGTFKSVTPQWTLNCKDGSNSTITVKGGTFYKFDPSNANVGDGEIIVPEGYTVVSSGDWYTVVAE